MLLPITSTPSEKASLICNSNQNNHFITREKFLVPYEVYIGFIYFYSKLFFPQRFIGLTNTQGDREDQTSELNKTPHRYNRVVIIIL